MAQFSFPARSVGKGDRAAGAVEGAGKMINRAKTASLAAQILRLMLLFSLSYGMLYFSYKYYNPHSGGHDFFEYYKIYLSPLDFSAGNPPFVFRQLGAIATHLAYIAGIYYPNAIWFHEPVYDQHVFFAALLTNYVCLVSSAWVVGLIVQHELGNRAFIPATFAGLVCLFSFYSQTAVVTGDTEGMSWLLTAVAFLMYLRRWLVPLAVVLALAVVQRELILVLFAAISGFFLLTRKEEKRFDAFVFVWSLVCFSAYVAMRKFAVALPDTTGQMHIGALLLRLKEFHVTRGFVFQAILSQNLLWVYIASALLLGWRARQPSIWLPVLLVSFLAIAIATVAAMDLSDTTNLGRTGGLLSPILAAGIAISIFRLDASFARPFPSRDAFASRSTSPIADATGEEN